MHFLPWTLICVGILRGILRNFGGQFISCAIIFKCFPKQTRCFKNKHEHIGGLEQMILKQFEKIKGLKR